MKNFKTWLKACIQLGKRWLQRWGHHKEQNFGQTDSAIYLIVAVILSILVGVSYGNSGLNYGVGFSLLAVACFIVVGLVYLVGGWIFHWAFSKGARVVLAVLLLWVTMDHMLNMWGLNALSDRQQDVLSFGCCIILYLFARSSWAVVRHRRFTKTTIFTFVVTTCCMTGILLFLAGDGYKDTYAEEYLQLNQTLTKAYETEDMSGFEQNTSHGNYTVETILYGNQEDSKLESGVVNLKYYVGSEGGLKRVYRNWHQGYGLDQVPLAGKVYYPKEATMCPVLFLIHGNHNFVTESYLGYDYLGEYLASNGYVVVSVDENSMNSSVFDQLSGENDGRAVLLLENIKQVQKYNQDPENVLYQKMDYENIAIAGHSRGGEAVSIAALFNKYDYYPENGSIKFNYHFNIKSVIAIAPTTDQYQPADHEVVLEDINYFLIQGANDQDLVDFQGKKMYEQVGFSGEGNYLKSLLYFAGANHGQFNELWGEYDRAQPVSPFLNTANFLSEQDQQEVLCTFSKVFLDATLKNETEYVDLLSNYQKYASVLPKTVYLQNYKDSSFWTLANYEEDSDLSTATLAGVTLSAKFMNQWTEEVVRLTSPSGTQRGNNNALFLRWTNKKTLVPEYNCEMEPMAITNQYFQLDVANLNQECVESGDYQNLDAQIVLVDDSGNEIEASLANYATIYPPLPVKLSKLQYLFDITEYKTQEQTVRIPIADFFGDKEFNAQRVTKISIRFPNQTDGKVRIDNIGFAD